MLNIHIDSVELFNEKDNKFVTVNECDLMLEHSLVSISKWESKWHKPFLDVGEKTIEEVVDYFKCMTVNTKIDPLVYEIIKTNKNIADKINNYINDPMSATTFTNRRSPQATGRTKEKLTSELIYFWMVSYNIPFDCQKWHINRLLNLIRICNIKNNPGKKMSKSEILAQNKSLNAMRKNKWHTHG